MLMLEANDAGLDVVVFAGGAVYPSAGHVLVARQGSGIQKPTDLKGKTAWCRVLARCCSS